jgi:hypothetical protein
LENYFIITSPCHQYRWCFGNLGQTPYRVPEVEGQDPIPSLFKKP